MDFNFCNNNMNAILIIIAFLIVVYLISWFFNGSKSLSDFADAKTELIIPSTSLPAGASVNYAYSIWMYIDDWGYRYGSEKIVFCRGNKQLMPGVSLSPIDNNLTIRVALEGSKELFKCTVQDIPIQKWTNLIVTLNNKSLDTYINGKLVKTCILPSPAYVDDTASVYLTPLTGFSGYTSRFNYWSDTVNPQQAWNIYKNGPGGNMFTNFLTQYKIQLNFLKGDNVEASITI
jgi:hypothetical protein